MDVGLIFNEVTGKYEPTNSVGTATPLVTEAGTATLTNKTLTAPTLTAVTITGTSTIGSGMTLTAPVLSGSVTGTYTLAGTPTITAPAISQAAITGTSTIGNGMTITTPVINNPALTGPAPVAYTSGTSLSLTQALHANRVVYVTDVASAYVLPLATGTGDKYTIILGATITGASTIKVANASDTFVGLAILHQDGGDTALFFEAAATDDTVDLLGTANSTGGVIGSIYEFWDVASGKWAVRIHANAGGTEATPFSATV